MVAVPQDRKKMGAMEGDGTDIIPTNLGNRVQKDFLLNLVFFWGFFWGLFFFFFCYPLLLGRLHREKWERKSPSHCPCCALQSLADVRYPGQLSAYAALLGVTAGEKQLSSVGKTGLDKCT